MKNNDFYRVTLKCFDAPGAAPTTDCFTSKYMTYGDAWDAVDSSAREETNNFIEEFDSSIGEFVCVGDLDDCDAVVRFWVGEPTEGDRDYYDITTYDIRKVLGEENGYNYRGFSLLETGKEYAVKLSDLYITYKSTFEDALDFVDELLLSLEIERDKDLYGMYCSDKYISFSDYFQHLKEVQFYHSLKYWEVTVYTYDEQNIPNRSITFAIGSNSENIPDKEEINEFLVDDNILDLGCVDDFSITEIKEITYSDILRDYEDDIILYEVSEKPKSFKSLMADAKSKTDNSNIVSKEKEREK